MSTDEPDPSDLPPAVRETLDSLGGALGDIAELDKEQLNETIGLLETLGHDQAAGILRSRREVLKGAGAATGLGIAGLAGATATGGARAQSDTQSGTIGNGNQDADLQDVSAESVTAGEIAVEKRITVPDGADLLDYAGGNTFLELQPRGDYVLSAPLPQYQQFGMDGGAAVDDAGAAAIKYTGPTGAGSRVIDWDDASSPVIGCVLRNISIDANGAETGFYGRYLTNRTHFDGVAIRGNDGGPTFDVSKAFYADLDRVVARDVPDATKAFYIHSTAGDVTDLGMNRPQANNVGGIGFDIDDADVSMRAPASEGCDEEGMVLSDAFRVDMQSAYFEGNGTTLSTPANLRSETSSSLNNLNITGGYYRTPGDGIGIDLSSNVIGSLRAGKFTIADANNRPAYHIDNESSSFAIMEPTIGSFADQADIDSAGWVLQGGTVN